MNVTYRGCNDAIPYLAAKRPVMKGTAADPATPIPATRPTHAVSSHRGRMCVMCETRRGNMGPRTRPIRETFVFRAMVRVSVLWGRRKWGWRKTYSYCVFDNGGYKPDC